MDAKNLSKEILKCYKSQNCPLPGRQKEKWLKYCSSGMKKVQCRKVQPFPEMRSSFAWYSNEHTERRG